MTWLNWPNRISIARIILVAPLVICLLNLNAGWVGWRYFAFGLFVVTACSDGLDGYLARRLNEETPLGRFLAGKALHLAAPGVVPTSPASSTGT